MSKTNVKLAPGQVWVDREGKEWWIQEIANSGRITYLWRVPGSGMSGVRNWTQSTCHGDYFRDYFRDQKIGLKYLAPMPLIEYDPAYPHVAVDRHGDLYQYTSKPFFVGAEHRWCIDCGQASEYANIINCEDTLVSCEPEKSERQKKIEELEAANRDMQKQINELKGMESNNE